MFKKIGKKAMIILSMAVFALTSCLMPLTAEAKTPGSIGYNGSTALLHAVSAYAQTDLKYITASTGKLSPAFSPGTLNYSLALKESADKVTLKAAAASSKSSASPTKKTYTVKKGQSVSASIKVKGLSGSKTYKVSITRAKSTNANLKSLKTSSSSCALKPAFKADKTSYTVTLPASMSSFTVSASPADSLSKATVQVTKKGVTKTTKTVSLNKGETATVTVTVNAQAGNTKVYTIAVNRLYGQWQQVWSDEFGGTSLDSSKWNAIDNGKNSNGELQYYLPRNVSVSNGYLYLTGKRETYKGMKYTSGYINTSGKFSLQYGKIEARIKLPIGYGFFPAFWLWQDNMKNPYQEIDIMEHIGRYPTRVYFCHHFTVKKKTTHDFKIYNIKKNTDFHTYRLEWTEKELRGYVDGKLYYKSTKNIPKESMFIVLNFAIGGVWPYSPKSSTKLPNSLVVDWVRVSKYI